LKLKHELTFTNFTRRVAS